MADAEGPDRTVWAESASIRVMVCDDHALFRRGLVMVLESEAGIEVVGEAEDGEEAIRKAEELTPDVVLMDVRMPRVNGVEATRAIVEVLPSTRVLMLTVSEEEAADARRLGIHARATAVLNRIHNAATGSLVKPFSRSVKSKLLPIRTLVSV